MYAISSRDQGILSYTIAETERGSWELFNQTMRNRRALVSPLDPVSIVKIDTALSRPEPEGK